MKDIYDQYRKLILSSLMIILFLIIVVILFNNMKSNGKVTYTLMYAPNDASITIGGVKTSPGKSYIEPGTYDVKATKEGYITFEKKVDITKNNTLIAIPLTPYTDKEILWVKKHQDQYKPINDALKSEDDNNQKLIESSNPIVKYLPYQNLLYSINYKKDPTVSDSAIVLEVSSSEAYRSEALYQIRQWGFDPTDYHIKFIDFTNRFDQ